MATTTEPCIWRRSPKTLDQVMQTARTKGLFYERHGDVLDIHDPQQGWITFFFYGVSTYYRRTPPLTIHAATNSVMAAPSFLCESCRCILPVSKMEIVEADQMQYTICLDCYESFVCALKELGYEVYDL